MRWGNNLHSERIERVATGADGNTNTVVEAVFALLLFLTKSIFTLIQLEIDLRQVVQLGDILALNLGANTTLQQAIEESVDVRFLGEIEERLANVRSLNFLEVMDDFLEQRKRRERKPP